MSEQSQTQSLEKRVVLDLSLCVECGACAAACYATHVAMDILQFGTSAEVCLPLVCRQCKEPACVAACPAEAMVRLPDGTVRRAPFRCRGCGSCVRACPFGVLSDHIQRHLAAKCDLCMARLGHDEAPACVATCPTAALTFRDAEGLEADRILILGGRTTGTHPLRRR
jgi:Fe-S-cluster-containing dehydrogenase component